MELPHDALAASRPLHDIRNRLLLSELTTLITAGVLVTPYLFISGQIDELSSLIGRHRLDISLLTLALLFSVLAPFPLLVRPVRRYLDAYKTLPTLAQKPPPTSPTFEPEAARILTPLAQDAIARLSNLPLLFTGLATARYGVAAGVLVALELGSGPSTNTGLMVIFFQTLLGLAPMAVFLFLLTERFLSGPRTHLAHQTRSLIQAGDQHGLPFSLSSRFLGVSLLMVGPLLLGQGLVSLRLLWELHPHPELIPRFVATLGWSTASALVVSLLIGALSANAVTDLIRRVTQVVESVGTGDLEQRLELMSNDELARLGHAFNQMVDQLRDSQSQLKEASEQIRTLNRGLELKVQARTLALELEASKNQAILESIPDGVLVVDGRQRAILANKALGLLLGVVPEDLQLRPVSSLALPEAFQRVLHGVVSRLVGNNPRVSKAPFDPIPLRFALRDRTLSASIAPIHQPGRELHGGYVVTVRDITAEVANAQLASRNLELVQTNRLRSQFLATVSHELRTPMNSVIGYCQVLLRGLDGPLNDEQREDVGRIRDSSEQLLGLINEILDLTKIDAGRLEISTRPLELAPHLHSVMMTVAPLARGKGLEVQVEVDPTLPPVWADQDRLRQVLLNLLSNAIKFTHEGLIQVVARTASGDQVEVAVKDTGVGIAPHYHEAIFEEFFQVDGSGTREFGGTGLGLPITRRLVELMGGALRLESALGRGSTLTFTLPRYQPEGLDAPHDTDSLQTWRPPSTTGTYPPDADGTGEGSGLDLVDGPPGPPESSVSVVAPRSTAPPAFAPPPLPNEQVILLITESVARLQLLTHQLSTLGYRTLGVARISEGLRMARELGPMAVLLDFSLSAQRMREVIGELRSRCKNSHLPILLLGPRPAHPAPPLASLPAVFWLEDPIPWQALQDALGARERRGARVLVVDDDSTVRDLLIRLLGSSGYQVESSRSGEEALRLIRENPPQVILLDLMMLPLTGFAVLERLQSMPETNNIHVIVLTARELTEAERTLLSRRASHILKKGQTRHEELLRALRDCTSRLRAPGPHPRTSGTNLSPFPKNSRISP